MTDDTRDRSSPLPGPPGLPNLSPEEKTPRDLPTPPARIRREVAETLARAEQAVQEVKEARRHSISEPVNLVDALEKLQALSDAKHAARLSEHENEEQAIASALAKKVDAVEEKRAEDARQATEDRAQIAQKLDKLVVATSTVFDEEYGLPAYRRWIVAEFKEAAKTIADRFLEPIGELIKEVANLKEKAMEHDLKLTKINARIDEIERLQAEHQREIDKIKQQIRNLLPRPI